MYEAIIDLELDYYEDRYFRKPIHKLVHLSKQVEMPFIPSAGMYLCLMYLHFEYQIEKVSVLPNGKDLRIEMRTYHCKIENELNSRYTRFIEKGWNKE